ncbi:MAG: hypothetical protein HYV93_11825 [Candidatus Rokubacteria bacterium]|nr:hypothetical protein [Candidatus Rokubacteria bacterium]
MKITAYGKAREQCPSDHEIRGQIKQTREGHGRGPHQGQNTLDLGEELHLQPWPLGHVPRGCLGYPINRLWREADSTQRLQSRL